MPSVLHACLQRCCHAAQRARIHATVVLKRASLGCAGVYADLDFQCLRPLDEILREKMVALGRMQDDVDQWEHALPNAFLASVPGHDLQSGPRRKS